MTSATFVLLSGLLTFGLPLLLALFELHSLRRPRGGDGDGPPPPPRVPITPKPLPDCLLPRPVAVRTPPRIRVLEDA